MLTFIITYFTGCLFYYVASLPYNLTNHINFRSQLTDFKELSNEWSEENDVEFYDFISLFYFSLVTLATIGYGDIVPKTNTEKVLDMLIMFCGVGFFSFIMGSFIEILQNFQKNVSGPENRTYEIDNWLKLLTRFRLNRPLPNELYKQIFRHFKHYW